MYRLRGTGVLHVAVNRQLDGFTCFQHLQVLKQQVVIHRVRMVVVGFNPLLHGQMALILVIAVFWNNTNVFITDLLTQLPIEGTCDKAFT